MNVCVHAYTHQSRHIHTWTNLNEDTAAHSALLFPLKTKSDILKTDQSMVAALFVRLLYLVQEGVAQASAVCSSLLPIPDTWSQAMSMARWAIFGPTPGRRTSPSTLFGMSPSNSFCSMVDVSFKYLTLFWRRAVEKVIQSWIRLNWFNKCCDGRVILCYPPEANRVDELPQCFIISADYIFHSAAVSSEPLHGRCRHLVLGLTGQHERHQHLEPSHLSQQQRRTAQLICIAALVWSCLENSLHLHMEVLWCRSISLHPCDPQVRPGCFSSLGWTQTASSSRAVPSALSSQLEHLHPCRIPPSAVSSCGCVKTAGERPLLSPASQQPVGGVHDTHLDTYREERVRNTWPTLNMIKNKAKVCFPGHGDLL